MGIKNRVYMATIYFGEDKLKNLEEVLTWFEEETIAWIAGEEIGEKEERYHLQCMMEFENPRSYIQVSKELNSCNLKVPRKMRDVYKYCEKGIDEESEDFFRYVKKFQKRPECWEGGKFNFRENQGKRNDLELVHELVEEGLNLREIASQANNYQGIRTAEKLLTL